MAKDEVSLLQGIIAELRQLNKSSKKDMIREREAIDRQEKLALGQEEVAQTSTGVMDSATDFQRRFLAGQAKTLLDKGRIGKQTDKEKQPSTTYWQEKTHNLQEKFFEAYDARLGDDAEDAREKDKDKKDKVKQRKPQGGLAKAARGAAGMAAIGLGLGGFMSGLMVWSGVDLFKGANFPEQAKNLKDGFNHIGKMDNKALIIMGSMVAAGGLFGATLGVGKSIKGAIGMSAVGLGLGGFMSGLMVFSEVDEFTGSNFPVQAENLVKGFNHIGGMSKGSIAALTAIIGIGAAGGAVSIGKTTLAAGGMALAGLGLGGFMAGMAAPGDLSGFKGGEFEAQSKNLAAGFKHLGGMGTPAVTALTSLAALGAITGAVSIGHTGMAAGGMVLAGMALGGFMAGIATAGDITGFKGENFAAQAKNIADGLGAFTGGQLAGLTALMATGAVLGPAGGAIAATGMGLIGMGIGAFVGGIAGIGDVLGAMGVNGSGLKTMLENIGGGLGAFNAVDGKNFSSLGSGMAALGIGLAALFGVNGLSKVSNFFSAAWADIKDMFGFDSDQRTGLEKLLDDIVKPFENIDFAAWNGINASGFGDNLEHIARGMNAWSSTKPTLWASIGTGLAAFFTPAGDKKPFEEIIALGEKSTEIGNAATAMEKLAKAMKSMTALEFKGDAFKFSKFAHDLVLGTQGMHVAMYGGTYDPPGWSKDKRKVTIGAGKGLASIPSLDFETAGAGITVLQRALNNWDGNTSKSGATGNTTNNSGGNVTNTTLITSPEIVDFNSYTSGTGEKWSW